MNLNIDTMTMYDKILLASAASEAGYDENLITSDALRWADNDQYVCDVLCNDETGELQSDACHRLECDGYIGEHATKPLPTMTDHAWAVLLQLVALDTKAAQIVLDWKSTHSRKECEA